MTRQVPLIPRPKTPRKAPRVLAKMRDAGDPGILFGCECGWEEWVPATFRDDRREKQPGEVGMTEARRGYPCPDCNETEER